MTFSPDLIWTLAQIGLVAAAGISLVVTLRTNQETLRETVKDLKALIHVHSGTLADHGERLARLEGRR